MSGHHVTPYELTATRKSVRDPAKRAEHLLLASLSPDATIDVLDAIEVNIRSIPPISNADNTRSLTCLAFARDGNYLALVFGADVSGEREQVRDGQLPGRPVVFVKDRGHVARIHSVCMVWRPTAEGSGVLLVHSPWGRGGSKGSVLTLLQRALDSNDPKAKAKLHADAMVPAKALARILRRANAAKITYRRSTGIRSTFSGRASSAPAEIDVIVRGSATIPFRDELAQALRATANRQRLFTIRVRDDKGEFHSETFDDVIVNIPTAGGVRQYSMRSESIPTLGYDLTREINGVYYGLPANSPDGWTQALLDDVAPRLKRLVEEVNRDV